MPLFNPAGAVTPRPIVSVNSNITTTSTTDVLATGMTDTPPAGTYLVMFGGSSYNDSTGSGLYVAVSIWAAGAQVADSERQISDSVSYNQMFQTSTIVTVDGSQAIEGRWRCSAVGVGTAYMRGNRSLLLIQIG